MRPASPDAGSARLRSRRRAGSGHGPKTIERPHLVSIIASKKRVRSADPMARLPLQHWTLEFELAVGAAKRPRTTTAPQNLLDFPDRRCTLPSTPRRSEKRLVYGEGDRPPELDGRHESIALLL